MFTGPLTWKNRFLLWVIRYPPGTRAQHWLRCGSWGVLLDGWRKWQRDLVVPDGLICFCAAAHAMLPYRLSRPSSAGNVLLSWRRAVKHCWRAVDRLSGLCMNRRVRYI
jgi:hypothetical protein